MTNPNKNISPKTDKELKQVEISENEGKEKYELEKINFQSKGTQTEHNESKNEEAFDIPLRLKSQEDNSLLNWGFEENGNIMKCRDTSTNFINYDSSQFLDDNQEAPDSYNNRIIRLESQEDNEKDLNLQFNENECSTSKCSLERQNAIEISQYLCFKCAKPFDSSDSLLNHLHKSHNIVKVEQGGRHTYANGEIINCQGE